MLKHRYRNGALSAFPGPELAISWHRSLDSKRCNISNASGQQLQVLYLYEVAGSANRDALLNIYHGG